MKVLFFTNPTADYLADSLLYGFLKQSGVEVHQTPVKEILYKETKGKHPIRGNGFTLYHLLDNMPQNTVDPELLKQGERYDLIVFSSIQRQFGSFVQYRHLLKDHRVWIVDGEDTPGIYGMHGYFWRNPRFWMLSRADKSFLYFKREWTPETIQYLYYKMLPAWLIRLTKLNGNFKKISFSIPAGKIVTSLPTKTKDFPIHIVDADVAQLIEGSKTAYAFEDEAAYYQDLQSSRFGITTKRSGWDCLRHYEIAANGAVICFKDLDQKPGNCAPHDLVINHNCLSYHSYDDLLRQIQALSEVEYAKLQANSLAWIKTKSCEHLVASYIEQFIPAIVSQAKQKLKRESMAL